MKYNTKATLLLVDDNTKNLQLLGSVLHENGYQVALAKDGSTALNSVKKVKPDLILLDVMMPDMDGFEVCRRLKEEEETAHIPVIFVTAKTDVDEIVKGFNSGGVDYITKPFNREELLVRIKTQLDLKASLKTIEKQTQELKEANALKDKVFSVIAHDLRGALGSVREFANMMTDNRIQLSGEELQEFFVALKEQADTTFELLENLLWWSRCQRKVISPSPEQFDIRESVDNVQKSLSYLINKKNIVLKTEVSPGIYVVADLQHFNVVMKNLIHNAIKFSPQGGKIEIVAIPKENLVDIEVIDYGVGIKPEDMLCLFDPNTHFSTYGTEGEKGSGLGLQVCHDLLSYSGGKIIAKSEKSKGSVFTVTLPNELV
ncbi:MAG: hybrid sensor histidine kinase/response regulator [Bacteroidales bacterium]|nr:hybrid sensor histidine kinase/response regulator [Bacteroidales bacterium]MDD3010131.1 hybrid sensor histidine kinase/response regulator [Bacteroidales bacterium]MDD3961992.1 hybrid sensor histidine kinase/response regulator [Bacteroidales bacterium]MDY0286905.1 hybrid sensor histidine kinase/response regulator [Bacteroidales bacterium]HPE87206.1 hybrid sensor histidine kinase/response regulator [Bacteroidales bacterium]